MENNRMLKISIGGSRKAESWPATELFWSEFIQKLQTPVRGSETYEEYLKLPKSQQNELKDVGGFVGGTLKGGRRKASHAEGRDLVTLDMDSIPAGGTDDVLRRVGGLGCAAVVYSTRKHAPYAPRLRVVIPLDRTATADEYEPAARKLAQLIGLELCDPTTFSAVRLMYWPSCCRDSEYIFQPFDHPFCSLDGVLGMYGDWRDITQWPAVPGKEAIDRKRAARQEDPTTKKGAVGAFCRTYTITQAMDRFLPGVYEPTDTPGRYTYAEGSTAGGAVVYDNGLFLFSHHATDPCSEQLVNAFDLVRLHKFGDLDEDAKQGTPAGKLPSYAAMTRLAREDPEVASKMAEERFEAAMDAFGPQEGEDVPDLEWIKTLALDGNGNLQGTINNIVIILENDPKLKGRILLDDFSGRGLAGGALPWDSREERREWKDVDDAALRSYIETAYGISTKDKIENACLIVSNRHKINDVEDYLTGLRWDGVKRIETLLPDYLGAEDNPYTRAVMRKSLTAAVARAIVGGVKYDTMPIFTGPQGIGKSTFLAILGGEWFSDSLTSFEGKDAAELIQGVWINEVGELTALNRQETNAVKQFLSKTDDIYRASYGRHASRHKRHCVFFGTSNETEFLKDSTGNRRFWPVDVGVHDAKKSVWDGLPEERDQIWAEAYAYFILGEKLFLPKELENLAMEAQEAHREVNGKEGMIREFLDRKIPQDWGGYNLGKRRQFWSGCLQIPVGVELVERDRVCAMEIWAECFNGDPKYLRRQESNEIISAMLSIKGWERLKTAGRFGPYGMQKGFRRVSTSMSTNL